ncbi:MAG TPA: hypothetical protein PLP23_06700 [Panacibacter sp.]|nr:hypothetical protein [Panacibacter sp.]
MRIKYDFEDDYKDVELGERLEYLLNFPKKYISMKLDPIKKEMEKDEKENEEACILIGGIQEDDPSITICFYSDNVKSKIEELFPINDKIYILEQMEDLLKYFR